MPVNCEVNRSADELVSLGCNFQEPLVLFEQFPPPVGPLLLRESLGIYIRGLSLISCFALEVVAPLKTKKKLA